MIRSQTDCHQHEAPTQTRVCLLIQKSSALNDGKVVHKGQYGLSIWQICLAADRSTTGLFEAGVLDKAMVED